MRVCECIFVRVCHHDWKAAYSLNRSDISIGQPFFRTETFSSASTFYHAFSSSLCLFKQSCVLKLGQFSRVVIGGKNPTLKKGGKKERNENLSGAWAGERLETR